MVAIAFVSELLHFIVFIIAHSIIQSQKGIRLTFLSSSISLTKSSSLLAPTLKSPSVARIILLLPSLIKFSLASFISQFNVLRLRLWSHRLPAYWSLQFYHYFITSARGRQYQSCSFLHIPQWRLCLVHGVGLPASSLTPVPVASLLGLRP